MAVASGSIRTTAAGVDSGTWPIGGAGMANATRTPTIRCPACHAEMRPKPILWGYPTRQGFEAAERGELVIGGCLVGGDDQTHVRPRCRARLKESADGTWELWGRRIWTWGIEGPEAGLLH